MVRGVIDTKPYRRHSMRNDEYVIGVKLGSTENGSALAIIEREPLNTYPVRWLKQWAPQTPYQKIASELVGLKARPELLRAKVHIVVDVTEPGQRGALPFEAKGLEFETVEIVSGFDVTFGPRQSGAPLHSTVMPGLHYRLPEDDMVTSLQLVLQARRMTIAEELEDADILESALLGFGHNTKSWRTKQSDEDYLIAVGIAIWWAEEDLFGTDDDDDAPRPEEKPVADFELF